MYIEYFGNNFPRKRAAISPSRRACTACTMHPIKCKASPGDVLESALERNATGRKETPFPITVSTQRRELENVKKC